MENLSELQNPLLDKNSKHMVNGYGGDFPNNQYQENIINYFAGGGGGGGGGEGGGGKVNNSNVVSGGGYNTNGKVKSQQLLDATSLHLAVEAFYRPNFILYKEDSGSIKAKEYKSECCETTFTEKKAKEASNTTGADTPGTEDPQAKLLEDGEHIKIQTVSYEVEEEEYVEYETDCSSDSESEDNFIVVPPRDHLGLAIFSMLCCFWPLGIAAFYFSQGPRSVGGVQEGLALMPRAFKWKPNRLGMCVHFICLISNSVGGMRSARISRQTDTQHGGLSASVDSVGSQ